MKQTERLAEATVKDLAKDQLKAASLALYTFVTSNTSGRARDIVKEESRSRNRVVAWAKLRDTLSKSTGTWSCTEIVRFQWSCVKALFIEARRLGA